MKSEIRLVKNSAVHRKPSVKGKVGAVFNRAMAKAEAQKWTKVIIVGQGKSDGSWCYSPMQDVTVVGMLEKLKYIILQDD